MIDFTKIGGYSDPNYGTRAYLPKTGAAPTSGGNTSITKPPTTTTPATTTAANTTGQAGGTTMPATNYTGYYPSQWQTASNTYTNIANADPANYGQWYDKAKQTAQYDITDAIRQAVEQAGMGGMRWSSTLGRTGQDIAARTMAGLGAQYAGNEMNAYQNNISNQLGAAQGLSGLGQQYAYLPMDIANNMMNMGSQMQGAYNQEISPYYSLWNSLQEYNSPWLQNALQMAQSSQPQQYNKSAFGNIWDSATSILPFLLF